MDNDFFIARSNDERRNRAELRAAWRIPPSAVGVLFCGKLIEKKRPLDVLKALDVFRRDKATVHLLVVGDGCLRKECEAFVAAKQLPVTFAGFLNQKEMPKAYAACDALVLPSGHAETWGLVVNEAMACGLCAIVSDRVGCGPDLVEDGVNGWRFRAGDVVALAERITTLTADRRLLFELGANARNRVRNFSLDSAVEGILKALGSLVQAKDCPV